MHGPVGNEALGSGESVVDPDSPVGDTQVGTVAAAFGAVHSASFGSVAVIEKLGRKACKHSPFLCLEHERRNCRGVLPEVHHKGFSRTDNHFLTGSVFLGNHHFTIFLIAGAFDVLPDVGLCRLEGYVLAHVDFSTFRGKDIAGELGVLLWSRKFLGGVKSKGYSSVEFLTIKDGSMLDRACDSSLPVFEVGAVKLSRSICKSEFDDSAESAFLSDHSVMASGSDYLVGPPSGSDMCGQYIHASGIGLEGICNVVSKGPLGFGIMGETGLKHFFADSPAVHIEFIDSETGGHPFGGNHLFLVLERGHEPAGSVRSARVVSGDASGDDRGVGYGNPLGHAPCGTVQGRNLFPGFGHGCLCA